jgi:hypothetical protein
MERFTVTTVAHEADQQPFTLPITVEAEDLADALYHFESKYFFETRYQLPVGEALFVIPLEAVRRIEIRRADATHE